MTSTATHLYTELRLKPGAMTEVRSEFEEFVGKTRDEAGCNRAELYRREDEDETYVLLAEFQDENALRAHLDADWRREKVDELRPWLDGDLDGMRRFTMQRLV